MTNRQPTLADFEALYEFWDHVGLGLYPKQDEKQRFEAMLKLNPDLCSIVFSDSGEIIGSIFGTFDGRTASIHRLAVAPALQSQGLGSKLIAQLEDTLRARGIQKLSAQIHISNTQVAPFYTKLGFAEMDYVKNFYKDL